MGNYLEAKTLMNELGEKRKPFLFIIDFEKNSPIVIPIDELDSKNILFEINGIKNHNKEIKLREKLIFKKYPVSYKTYNHAFNIVKDNLKHGNTYLLNLTFPTSIDCNLSLKEIFYFSEAKYKLWYKDKFVVFSPEIFVKIKNGKIFSHPMKGTIDASLPNAKEKILSNKKEYAEHVTIVDLIRNDLSMIAKNVKVDKFRYVDEIITNEKNILQISSIISGDLQADYYKSLGDIFFTLLPAGSICGAPKQKTIEIINEVENYKRGFYTGVFGYFDGKNLDSGVMIRFIEKIDGKMIFKSGGGITVNSDSDYEYNELIDKVYVPVI
ncbi:MAG: aminodeoxychorismate synthase component I [Bacteroidota bacterium]|nr:aminodeoxychorismate synthase component I [Bacteroidota bacterium]